MKNFKQIALFILLGVLVEGLVYATASPAGFVWTIPTADSNTAYTVIGTSDYASTITNSATTVVDSSTRTQALRIPQGAKWCSIMIRSGTYTPYTSKQSTLYSSPAVVSGSLIAYCTPQVVFFPDLVEARKYVNGYQADWDTPQSNYSLYSAGNGTDASFYDDNPNITNFGMYKYHVEGYKAMLIDFEAFSAGSASLVNASGIFIKVRFTN